MPTPCVINWLIPEPSPRAGGDIGIFRVMRELSELGHICRGYVVPYRSMLGYTSADIRSFIEAHFGVSKATYERWTGSAADADCTFATFWPTAEELQTLPNGGEPYYLVQDFEPSFYPLGSINYRRAEQTYRAGFHCITLGRWLTRLLRQSYEAKSDYFDFAVDTGIYWPRPGAGASHRRICFYARPATPRRAYELGVSSLQIVRRKKPNVEIVFFGTEELNPAPAFPHTNLGVLDEEQLAKLFSRSDVGVVFSMSNPSFVPLEMAACRCAVVEIASQRWEGILEHGRNAWLVPAETRAVADGIIRLLSDNGLRQSLADAGYRGAFEMSWSHSARQIEAFLPAPRTRTAPLLTSPQTTLSLTPAMLPSQRLDPKQYGIGAWTEHIYFAYDLMAKLRPKVFVELGTDRGESYFAFCQSALENETGTRCFAIDHWHGDSHAGGYDATTFNDVQQHNREHYSAFSTLMRSTFDAALGKFEPETIDLLHIDGHHTEEAVRQDLASWLPKVRPGGILLLHDIAMRARDFGVWKVWRDLRQTGRSGAFPQPPGLGIWQKPPARELPPLIEALLSAPNESQEMLQLYYHRRNAELQAKMRQQWNDGSIRFAPMASQTVIQVFWANEGDYAEEYSIDARIGHTEDWKEVAIPVPSEEDVRRLRIDFFSALTIVEIEKIAIETRAGSPRWSAAERSEFGGIALAGDCIRLDSSPLVLQITGMDPQVHLPPLPSLSPTEGVVVRMRLRVRSGLSANR